MNDRRNQLRTGRTVVLFMEIEKDWEIMFERKIKLPM